VARASGSIGACDEFGAVAGSFLNFLADTARTASAFTAAAPAPAARAA
jgi:hypothetical protein